MEMITFAFAQKTKTDQSKSVLISQRLAVQLLFLYVCMQLKLVWAQI